MTTSNDAHEPGNLPWARGTRETRRQQDASGRDLEDIARERLFGAVAGPAASNGTERSDLAATARPVGRIVLARGTIVGRYLLLDKLGAGGMGVVYAAYDPELDRKVALKLVLPQARGNLEVRRTQLLREAQALAKLAHPNIVTIHDVGTYQDQIWIAMEFVAGQTLDAWVKGRVWRWPEILRALSDAARGVAAAHAVGLVHRDLKPENVMVGKDGRVRVMDFGLAHGRSTLVSPRESSTLTTSEAMAASEPALAATLETDPSVQPQIAALAQRLTRSGALQGTPAYMAPEQWRAEEEITAAADQFGWSVMAWEMLFGERPFAGGSLRALADAVLSGKYRAPPRGRRVPTWLRRALQRGLSTDPARRWPTMSAYLETIEHGARRARQRIVLISLACLALLAGGIWAWQTTVRLQRVASCESAGASIQTIWNEGAKQQVRAALIGTDVSFAATTADKVIPWLDRQAVAWQNTETAVCLDATVHGTKDLDLLRRSTWCLDERRIEFAALVSELSSPTKQIVSRAVIAATALLQPHRCSEESYLRRMPMPPIEQQAAIQELNTEVAQLRGHFAAGTYGAGLELVDRMRERAEYVGWMPLLATIRYQTGVLLQANGQFADAEKELEEAYFAAVNVGATKVAADAAVLLTYVITARGRYLDAERWSRLADAALRLLEPEPGLVSSTWLHALGNLELSRGAPAKALDLFGQMRGILESLLGADHPQLANSLHGLAIIHYHLGEYAESTDLNRGALRIRESQLGLYHPDVATSLLNLALIQTKLGAPAEALLMSERALEINRLALGETHPTTLDNLMNIAASRYALGDYFKALEIYERVLAAKESTLGVEHPAVAVLLNALGNIRYDLGMYTKAREHYERSLSIRRKLLATDHLDIGVSLQNLANIERAAGNLPKARVLAEQALVIAEKHLGPDHVDLASARVSLADVLYQAGAYAEARALYRQALASIDAKLGMEHVAAAECHNGLGDVERATGDIGAARKHYRQALTTREKAFGVEHPLLGYPLTGLAEVELTDGDILAAREYATRALAVWDGGKSPPERLADARFVLAKALEGLPFGSGRDHQRARELALQARTGYANAAGKSEALAAVDRWLAQTRS